MKWTDSWKDTIYQSSLKKIQIICITKYLLRKLYLNFFPTKKTSCLDSFTNELYQTFKEEINFTQTSRTSKKLVFFLSHSLPSALLWYQNYAHKCFTWTWKNGLHSGVGCSILSMLRKSSWLVVVESVKFFVYLLDSCLFFLSVTGLLKSLSLSFVYSFLN